MPQTSPQMNDLMQLWFGDPVSDMGPMEYLKAQGYTLLPSWYWQRPSTEHYVDVKEELCIRFLIEEWDFGGIHE